MIFKKDNSVFCRYVFRNTHWGRKKAGKATTLRLRKVKFLQCRFNIMHWTEAPNPTQDYFQNINNQTKMILGTALTLMQ